MIPLPPACVETLQLGVRVDITVTVCRTPPGSCASTTSSSTLATRRLSKRKPNSCRSRPLKLALLVALPSLAGAPLRVLHRDVDLANESVPSPPSLAGAGPCKLRVLVLHPLRVSTTRTASISDSLLPSGPLSLPRVVVVVAFLVTTGTGATPDPVARLVGPLPVLIPLRLRDSSSRLVLPAWEEPVTARFKVRLDVAFTAVAACAPTPSRHRYKMLTPAVITTATPARLAMVTALAVWVSDSEASPSVAVADCTTAVVVPLQAGHTPPQSTPVSLPSRLPVPQVDNISLAVIS